MKGQAELLQVEPACKTKAKRARPRDPLFDALATACGHNLAELTDSAASSIRKALADILRASPHATPEEITRRVCAYRSRHPQRQFSEHAIAKDWSRLGGGGTRSREELEAILAKHPGNPNWSGNLAQDITPEQRKEFADLGAELKRLSQPESRAA